MTASPGIGLASTLVLFAGPAAIFGTLGSVGGCEALDEIRSAGDRAPAYMSVGIPSVASAGHSSSFVKYTSISCSSPRTPLAGSLLTRVTW